MLIKNEILNLELQEHLENFGMKACPVDNTYNVISMSDVTQVCLVRHAVKMEGKTNLMRGQQ